MNTFINFASNNYIDLIQAIIDFVKKKVPTSNFEVRALKNVIRYLFFDL